MTCPSAETAICLGVAEIAERSEKWARSVDVSDVESKSIRPLPVVYTRELPAAGITIVSRSESEAEAGSKLATLTN